MEHKNIIAGVGLLCVAVSSQALTLGRIHGAAVIGQPLSLVVQVQLDPTEDAASLCFAADVFHADNLQDANRVRVTVEPGAQASTANVRVSSSIPVDEPMVTVYLHSMCGQKLGRRYVMLSDFPSETQGATQPISLPVAAPQPAPDLVAAPASAPLAKPAVPAVVATPAPLDIAGESKPPAAAPVAPKPVVAKKPKPPVVAKKPAAPPVVAAKPAKAASEPQQVQPPPPKVEAPLTPPLARLKLDPVDVVVDPVTVLALPPTANAEDLQKERQKVSDIQADMKALLALSAKNEASLADLRTRLQQAESERFPAWIIYALGALVAACLAALAALWSRLRQVQQVRSDDWWSGSMGMPLSQHSRHPSVSGAASPAHPLASSEEPSGPATLSPSTVQVFNPTDVLPKSLLDEPSAQDMDVSLVEMSESNFDKLMQTGSAHSALRKVQVSPPATATSMAAPAVVGSKRNLSAELVFDVRQQAEFFVSLGQTDQAVRILERHIADADAPSPFVYLDLLNLFHSLSLKVDFRQCRNDLMQYFNVQIPEFTFFKSEGKGLEAYPQVLAQVIAAWGHDNVVDVTTIHLVRDSQTPADAALDLAAFRELLLLHSVAQSVARMPHTDSLEVHVPEAVRGETHAALAAQESPDSLSLNLDLDLTDFDTPSSAFGQPRAMHTNPGVKPAPGERPSGEPPLEQTSALPRIVGTPSADDDVLLDFDLSEHDKLYKKPGDRPPN